MALNRKFQLCVAEETQPGIAVTDLFSASNADFEPIEPRFELDVDDVQREVVRGTLTKATPLSGLTRCTVRFGIELAGHRSAGATDIPKFSALLRACGMHHVLHRAIAVDSGSFTGPLLHGEIITGGTSSETGMVIGDVADGQSLIRYVPVSGGSFTAGETVTGGTSGSDVDLNSPTGDSPAGSSWYPISGNKITIDTTSGSGDVAAGDILKGATSGAIIRALAAHYSSGTNPDSGDATGDALEFEVLDGTLTGGETFNNVTTGQTGSFTYTDATIVYVDMPTLSIGVIEDGRAKKAAGCRGTFSIEWQNGRPTVINFTFTGLWVGSEDRSPIAGVTRTNRAPVIFRNADFQVGGVSDAYGSEYQPRVSQFSFDIGNNVAMREDCTATQGYTEAIITDRTPTLSMNPLAQPEAAFGFINSVAAGTPFRLRARQGTASADRFAFTFPGVKVTGNAIGDREGETVDDITASLSGYSSDGTDREDNEFVMHYETVQAGW